MASRGNCPKIAIFQISELFTIITQIDLLSTPRCIFFICIMGAARVSGGKGLAINTLIRGYLWVSHDPKRVKTILAHGYYVWSLLVVTIPKFNGNIMGYNQPTGCDIRISWGSTWLPFFFWQSFMAMPNGSGNDG